MKIVLGIVVVMLIAAGVVLAIAARRPDRITLERHIDIKAPAEKIFPLINDFQNWPKWSEPAGVKRTLGPITSGQGATCEWSGSGSAGAGRLEIVQSIPTRLVSVKADFRKPFEAHNINHFVLEPHGEFTTVTWGWNGDYVFMMRLMSVFVEPGKMIGSHFEDGLQSLKRVAEAE